MTKTPQITTAEKPATEPASTPVTRSGKARFAQARGPNDHKWCGDKLRPIAPEFLDG